MRWIAVSGLVAVSSLYAGSMDQNEPFACQELFLKSRHVEHRGIGYQEGYTTLELFAIPSQTVFGFYPYCDLRGHIFNDGKGAFNAGLGARFLKHRIWGFNTYYNIRKAHKKLFNQVAAGFESIGKRWDFYANGYLVVGAKKGPV
jgi:hypothetical protein